MSITDELRRLLDERGVEWWPLGSEMTECVIDGIRYKFRQVGRGLIVSTCTEGTVTPEQAIAATLGDADATSERQGVVGTCKADETERIWCRYKGGLYDRFLTVHVMECSACGGTYEYVNGSYEFCPRCGRRVVE